MGVSSTGTLRDFVLTQEQKFYASGVNPEEVLTLMAKALVEELTKTTPGPGKHPLATGNLLSALTTVSAISQESKFVHWIGVGDMSRLGHPGEQNYAPEPIKRFLKEYRDEQVSQREQRAKDAASRKAARDAERKRLAEVRAKEAYGKEQAEWYRYSVRNAEKNIANLEKQLLKMQDAWDKMQSELLDLPIQIDRMIKTGSAYKNDALRNANERRDALPGIMNAQRARRRALEARIVFYKEALMKFKQRYSYKIRGR